MYIRDACLSDLVSIVDIYNCSIPTRISTGDLEPISLESRLEWFHNHPPDKLPLWVAQIEGNIAGWLSFQAFYGRAAYHKTAEVSIYVSPNYFCKGVGKTLLRKAINDSPALGLNTLIGYIFAHNQASLSLFTTHEFQQWGYLPGVADMDGVERDLVIMGRRLR